MNLKEIGIDMRNWVDLVHGSPCECSIEPTGFISHGLVSFMFIFLIVVCNLSMRKVDALTAKSLFIRFV